MTFSTEWDDLYRSNAHLSIWPWTDLVSYVHRYAPPSRGYRRTLELGCGAGANIPFFQSLNSDYWAIEGSPTIVESVVSRYPELKDRIIAGDFTVAIPFEGQFDLVVDRISLAHNSTEAMQNTLNMIFDRLRSGGKFIGIDWFSDQHQDSRLGEMVDSHTRKNLPSHSTLKGTGVVHFCDKDHLVGLLEGSGFRIERLEHKQSDIMIPEGLPRLANWNFAAVRP